MRPTLIAIHHREIDGHVFHHGAEIMLDLLSQEAVGKLIDQGEVREYPQRRSLYRIFPVFSGAKEKEQLDADELKQFALPD